MKVICTHAASVNLTALSCVSALLSILLQLHILFSKRVEAEHLFASCLHETMLSEVTEDDKPVDLTGNKQKPFDRVINDCSLKLQKQVFMKKKATIRNANVILSSNMDEIFSVDPGSSCLLHMDQFFNFNCSIFPVNDVFAVF